MQKRANVLRLTESAIMIAFATVLSEIQIANLPFGGSVTACSMLPILIIAYRYGTSWGIFTAVVNGLMQMLLGMGNLKYGTSAMAVIIIVLFDYIIAFGVLGLGGIFRKSIKNQGLSLAAGGALACILRYLCHIVSGYFVWYIWAWDGYSPLAYAAAYNATYMIPETIITVAGALLISLVLDFSSEDITRRSRKAAGVSNRNNSAFSLKIVAVFVAVWGIFQVVYTVINEFIASAEPDITKESIIQTLILHTIASVVLYALGEGVQILHDIRASKLSSSSVDASEEEKKA